MNQSSKRIFSLRKITLNIYIKHTRARALSHHILNRNIYMRIVQTMPLYQRSIANVGGIDASDVEENPKNQNDIEETITKIHISCRNKAVKPGFDVRLRCTLIIYTSLMVCICL